MDILIWTLFGILVGILSITFEKSTVRGGMMSAILLGISGSLLGGFLASIVFNSSISGFNLNSFIVAVIGSVVLLYIGKEIKGV